MNELTKELKRKSFHLLGLIYLVELFYIPRPVFVWGMVAWTVGVLIFEVTRLNIPAFNDFLFRNFGYFLREKEKSKMTGMFWMALGVLVSSILLPNNYLAAAAIGFLMFGDAVASLGGIAFKGPKWGMGSPRRLSGSFSCLVVCLIVGFSFLHAILPWPYIVGGAVVATLAEAGVFQLDDNFTIAAAPALYFFLIERFILLG